MRRIARAPLAAFCPGRVDGDFMLQATLCSALLLIASCSARQPAPEPLRGGAVHDSDASEGDHVAVAPGGNPEGIQQGARSCEPWGYCGCWFGCVLVEEVEGGERPGFRVLSGEYQGMVYHREHSCYPDEGPDRRCYEWCTGTGEARRCVDGLVQMEVCTVSCVPAPPEFNCVLLNGECTRSPDATPPS